ncbi:MAG: TolB family protein [Planctomycetota bacterium]|jgi:hypothetical protein
MIKIHKHVFLIIVPVILIAGVFIYFITIQQDNKLLIEQPTHTKRTAKIHPDYCDIVIPPNISPLNFMVEEDGLHFLVKIYSQKGGHIKISSKTPKIIIPEKPWHKLLEANLGQQLFFEITIKTKSSSWKRYALIKNKIAQEPIDGFIVYRKMYPTHQHKSGEIAIYQRNLFNYKESLVLSNRSYRNGCVNCHSFCNNNPDEMLIGVRSFIYGTGTLLLQNNAVAKIGAKFGYTCWHPSGKLATFSINKLPMAYHSSRNEVRDTIDLNSLLAYYLVESKTIKTLPQIARKEILENWPAWSANGEYLYFCSAPMWSEIKKYPPSGYDRIKYGLVRISYDIKMDKWGEVESVLSPEETGLSIAMPRFSPDGYWLSFCMCGYGYFPTWQRDSDLYIANLKATEKTGKFKYKKLELNSSQSESWHSWSSNSRWIVFSSKRKSMPLTRLYFSYIDETGKAYKPFIAPKKDPTFYDFCIETNNTPEFIVRPIRLIREKLARAVRGPNRISVDMPITMATPKAVGLPSHDEPWQERE